MNTELKKMILEGEHLNQDFKHCISDSRKIARSLVAFANTDGGRLLVGVKDNGNIAGVRTDEEYYMVESAAKIYSNPPIAFNTRQHIVDQKTVLEVIVENSPNKPHFAQDTENKWWAYYRLHDENKLANKVMIEVWRKQQSKTGIFIRYSNDEKFLLDYLAETESISQSAFSRKAQITYKKAATILSDFIVLGILRPVFGGQQIRYALADSFDRSDYDRSETAR
ncbi:helix-turn-helix domain-containing protein [Mangrovibacterium sp.]|uniref:AlbA family DNA-binding domain-containing protein n=1 Tax=Mangrovibacterium sp. TaxID=1961364 RepID=UPI003566C1E1